jgi:integrase
MNYVEPIRDPELVKSIADYFKKINMRNFLMFIFGIYSGLRISDILKFKIYQIKNKDHLNIRATKTGKQVIIEINPILKQAIVEYIKDKDPDDYLFKSRQNYNKPIGRSMAYKILREAAEKFGLENIGCHTLRKTFGYHYYKQYKDAKTLMEIFGHSHISVTLRYIGINQEIINDTIRRFKIY